MRFELTGLTPGSEYLVKVNGRERKSGVADHGQGFAALPDAAPSATPTAG